MSFRIEKQRSVGQQVLVILAVVGCLMFGQLSASGGVEDVIGHRAGSTLQSCLDPDLNLETVKVKIELNP